MTSQPTILFLCVHNAGRSQMAAAFARRHDGVTVLSAGSEPASSLNPAVIEAMRERGIDLQGELPQRVTEDMARTADVIVTMGCGDACPVYAGRRYIDWDLEDPAGKSLVEIRPIRDDIERRVDALIAGVQPGSGASGIQT
jgi:arsenate reductase (thioredoxin)